MQTKQYLIIMLCLLALSIRAQKRKLDSLLNLKYTSYYYPNVLTEITKLDKAEAQKIDSSMAFMNSLPNYWGLGYVYRSGLAAITYKQLPGYVLLVEEDFMLYEKIGKKYPGSVQMEEIRVMPAKPVIYLYPEKETDITVHLKFESEKLYTWPQVDDKLGWSVTAQPDGMLKDKAGEEYPYLFWESVTTDYKWVDFSEGFVVSAENSETFLREKLKYLGLNSREYTDFITYWGPHLRENKYNLIRLETTAYDKALPIEISPKPDTIQRVFMVYKALSVPVEVKEQELKPFVRKGYTVIEWGGMVMPNIVN